MLRSDFRREAHSSFQNYFFLYTMCFFQHIDVKSTSISRKIKVHIESNFHLSISKDVSNHYNATNIKKLVYFSCVNNPTTYKFFDASETTVPHFVTSL